MNFTAAVQAVAAGFRSVDQIRVQALAAGFTLDEQAFGAKVAEFKGANKLHTWDAEVFAVGTWNGYPFTRADLDKMVEAFEALHGGGYLEAPLKFGHNDEQPMIDGQPAIGWVEKLYVAQDDKGRDKLFATFGAVPEVVYNMARSKRYRKVSIELEFDVTHKGVKYPYVLTGVALLGADLPAVNTLADLDAYMSRGSLTAARKLRFSVVEANGNTTNHGGTKMPDITEQELAQLRADAARAKDLDNQVANFNREKTEREQREKTEKVVAARAKFNKLLDDAVKDMRITPAQRSAYAKTLGVDTDAVAGLVEADVEALLPEKQKDQGGAFGRKQGEEGTNTDQALDLRAREIINNSGGKLKYGRALEMAMAEKPDLAKAHLGLGQS